MNDGSIGDDLQGAEVSGIKGMGDQLQSVVMGTKTVKAAFHDMAQSIIGDLLKIAVQRSIEQPLANLLFPSAITPGNFQFGAAAPAAGGIFGSISSMLGNIFHFADGGPVPGSGNSDSVPAFLTPGEFVLSRGMLNNMGALYNRGASVLHHTSVQQHFHVDARGSLGFDEFTAQQDAKMQARAQAAAVAGATGGHQMTMQKLSDQRRYGLGRR